MSINLKPLLARLFGGGVTGGAMFEPLRPVHAAAVSALHRASFARGWDAPDVARMIADPAIIADGLFIGGARQPSGFVMSRVAADEAEILSIALDPAWRGHGLSGRLLGQHLPHLQRRGAARLFLEVEEGNAPAAALYRRAGFALVGAREGYYRKPDGSRARAHVMKLDL